MLYQFLPLHFPLISLDAYTLGTMHAISVAGELASLCAVLVSLDLKQVFLVVIGGHFLGL